ncbi:HEAT repeat domain-containing protein [Dactylosporangium sp. CA-139066]|uniref:HEAT repeat domain-containing protein n=1 Tax=Dactylosporangium sp. CA-139066 TaxID=3239930 RepID=UPI003D8A7E3D
MFTGLDDIDWASLEHAYGSARDVPGWVRGLVDPDPAVRERSLDAMYGAVHHQGDVYDSTVAAVPYLIEALTAPGLPGRDGIAELLASIAELSEWPDETELDEDDAEMLRQAARANALALAAAPALIRLADDPDPAVRAAAPKLLIVVAAKVPDLTGLLIGLLGTEDDAGVRRGLFDALGSLELGDDAIGHLLGLARSAPASTALTALIAVARNDPHRVPLDGVPDLIGRAYAEEGPAAEPAGFQTDTLIGSLRVMREELDEGRRAPHCTRMVENLTDALGPRVPERIAIVTPLLASPHDDLAGDALFAANKLIEGWRGDYREAVTRIAGLLDRSRRLAGQAAGMLNHWGPLAAPAAETIARRLAAIDAHPWRDGLPEWTIRYTQDLPGLHPYIETLAGLRDERALPLLLTALRLPQRPKDTGYKLAHYAAHADRITAEIVPVFPLLAAGDRAPTEWYALQVALRAFGPAAAPAVPRLLASPLRDWSAATLGRVGPAAAEALPALRVAAAGDDPRLAVAAAGALWRIDRSPDVLTLLTAQLDGPAANAAFEEIAAMGSAAAPAAPLVASYLDAPPGRHWWTPTHAALTLWRLTGDAERVAPVLTAAWHGNPQTRTKIAEAATGAPAAALQPLFRAELAADRRFNVSPHSWSSVQVTEDERLLELCRAVVQPPAR